MTSYATRIVRTPARSASKGFVFPCLRCGLALLAISLCGAAPGSIDEVPYEQRTDAFRRLLFELRFEPLKRFADLEETPSKSLFIVLGNPKCLSKGFLREGLRSFVEKGGAVLIATDMGTRSAELRKLAGVTVTGKTLVVEPSNDPSAELNPFAPYNNSKYCPFVEPIEESKVLGVVANPFGAAGRPDLFRQQLRPDQPPLRVATNAPSCLGESGLWLRIGIHRLARLPRTCREEKSKGQGAVDEEGPLFAAGGTVGKGRVLVLADHSIFINRMILPRDNGNLEFAANCLHWLRGGASTPMEALQAMRSHAEHGNEGHSLTGQRNRVLFWDDGTLRSDFEVPLKKMPMPPAFPSESAIVAAIDKAIAKLEANDSLNRAILEQMDDLPGGRPRVVRYAVYLLTLAAALFLAYFFLWRSRHRQELAVPVLAKTLRDHEPRASLLDQRRRALLRLGNVWEIGHHLARECIESAGLALTTKSPPRLWIVQGSRWQRWRVRRRMVRMWRLARGDGAAPLSPAALQRLLHELDQLKTDLSDGTIVLSTE